MSLVWHVGCSSAGMNWGSVLGLGLLASLIGCGDGGTGSGGSGGGGGSGGNEGGSGGDAPSCVDFDVAPTLGPTVKIRFENNTTQTLYFGAQLATCESTLGFLARSEGMNVKTTLATCELTCSAARTSGCACPAACAEPLVIQIAPGAAFETDWLAAIYDVGDMPVGCWNDPTCRGGGCVVGRAPQTALDFEGFLFTELADCGRAICDCTPGGDGTCVVEGATLVLGTSKVVTTKGWLPGETLLTLDFQPEDIVEE